jgi:hypothetical protein
VPQELFAVPFAFHWERELALGEALSLVLLVLLNRKTRLSGMPAVLSPPLLTLVAGALAFRWLVLK